jgi:hypothetical protein
MSALLHLQTSSAVTMLLSDGQDDLINVASIGRTNLAGITNVFEPIALKLLMIAAMTGTAGCSCSVSV